MMHVYKAKGMYMKKIIFIYERFFTIRDYHRFGMEYLVDKGYDVEMWRVDIECRPSVRMTPSIGLYQEKNVYDVSHKEFGKYVQRNQNALFILFEYQSLVYMWTMARYHCEYFLIVGTGKILSNGNNTLRVKDITKTSTKIDQIFKAKYHEQIRRMAEWIFAHHLPQYIFLGVDIDDKCLARVPNNKKIYVHSLDYDRYLEVKHEENEKGEWIVYIDSGFGNLDMNQLVIDFNNPWYGKGDALWSKIENIFDKLEQHYHIPVVIAGHPHTKYEGEYLCNRKIIFNRTPELIAKSKFVIMQWSTSISLVLLLKKDILVLVDQDFRKVTNWESYYKASYQYFGITPCNMDVQEMAEAPWKYVHKIDSITAQNYISTYVKMPETPNKLFVEVVEEKIRQIQKRKRKSKRKCGLNRIGKRNKR